MKTTWGLCFLGLAALVTPLRADEKVFEIPGEGWRVVVNAPPLSKIEESRRGADYALKGNSGRFNLSLFVETPQSATGSHKECYEFYWPRARRNPMIDQTSIRVSHSERCYRVEHISTYPLAGKTIQQKSVNYYFAFNSRWMDLHISVIEPRAGDEEIFHRFDAGLRYELMAAGRTAVATPAAAAGRPLAGNRVELTFPLADGGELVLAAPAAWKGAVAPPRDAMPGMVTVDFTRENANGFHVLLSVFPKAPPPGGQTPTLPQLRTFLEGGSRMAMATAEEKELVIKEFKEGEVAGCYFQATDRNVPAANPPVGQAKYLLQATVLISGRLATLTTLSNTPGQVDQNAALEMIKTARCR